MLHLFNQIGEIEAMIASSDLTEFLAGYDKLKEAISFLEQNSGGVGAVEKLEKCRGMTIRQAHIYFIALQAVAKANLSKKFKEALERVSVPHTLDSILERHNMGEEWPETLDFIPPNVCWDSSKGWKFQALKQIKSLAKRNLKDNVESSIIEEYVKIRSSFLMESISRTFSITMEEVSDAEKAEGETDVKEVHQPRWWD